MALSLNDDPLKNETEHVHKVYSQIASHFSDTRYKPWPRIAEFLESLPVGSIVADVGCGNGKYLGVNDSIFIIGSDICPELVAIATGRGHSTIVSDCLYLPYKSAIFDAVICIAVIHHLSTEERRLEAIREMVRVLRVGGQLLLYVWAMEQTTKKFSEQDVMVPWHLKPKYSPAANCNKPKRQRKPRKKKKPSVKDERQYVKTSTEVLDEGTIDSLYQDTSHDHLHDTPHDTSCDQLHDTSHHQPEDSGEYTIHDKTDVLNDPLQLNDDLDINPPCKTDHALQLAREGYVTYHRYYHVFCEGELKRLCLKLPDIVAINDWYDHENWCIIVEKIKKE